MSALVHCDGPGCGRTKSAVFEDRRLCDPDWMMLEASDQNYDFHSKECLSRWVEDKPMTMVPRSTAQTVVDGR